jgi:acrylyl-CoA reductase (NADPH)
MSENFRALVLEQRDGATVSEVRDVPMESLPAGEVLVDVEYSSLNYKDGLAVTGTGKVIRQFPMIPGIDLAGAVRESTNAAYRPGDRVILTGWGIGERSWGGYAQKARAKASWLVKLPEGIDAKHAMAIGTAGFTAMLSVIALENHGAVPQGSEIAVSGAAGGLGSVAVAILAKLGYKVVASTGRPETRDYLLSLGAQDVVDRALFTKPGKPMEAERWQGAVDTVGGATLAGIIRSLKYGGSVAACGMAGGADLATSVFPFILRGVNLLGIDSVYCPMPAREKAWQRLAADLPLDKLNGMSQTIALSAVPEYSREILAGKVRGRVVIDVNA